MRQVVLRRLCFYRPLAGCNGFTGSIGQQVAAAAYLFDGQEVELNVDQGATWLHGSIVFDGFYLIKYGGTHQGILSFGLKQVDEATVILNPAIQVVDQAV